MRRASSSSAYKSLDNLVAVVAAAAVGSAERTDWDVDFAGLGWVAGSIDHHVHVRGRDRVYRRLCLCILDDHRDFLDNPEIDSGSVGVLVGSPASGLPFA